MLCNKENALRDDQRAKSFTGTRELLPGAEQWVEQWDVIILDHLSACKSEKAAQSLETNGHDCCFRRLGLPPPTPFEMSFSKHKAHLRKVWASTYQGE